MQIYRTHSNGILAGCALTKDEAMDQIAILIPLVAGITATVFTIVIHSVALTAVIRFVRRCVCYVVASEPHAG